MQIDVSPGAAFAVDGFFVLAGEVELGDRVAKALVHAAFLRGSSAKTEPFDTQCGDELMMKVFLFCICSMSARAAEPSLIETLTWVQKNAAYDGMFRDGDISIRKQISYTFSDCTIVVTEHSEFNGYTDTGIPANFSRDTKRFTAPLATLNPHTIVVKDTGLKNVFRSSPNTIAEIILHFTSAVVSYTKNGEVQKSQDGFFVLVDDAEIGARVAKALAHAARLCGSTAKPEPF